MELHTLGETARDHAEWRTAFEFEQIKKKQFCNEKVLVSCGKVCLQKFIFLDTCLSRYFKVFKGFSDLEVGSHKKCTKSILTCHHAQVIFFDNFHLLRKIYKDHCLTEKWKYVLAL